MLHAVRAVLLAHTDVLLPKMAVLDAEMAMLHAVRAVLDAQKAVLLPNVALGNRALLFVIA
jgi:hypothetical protein